MEGSITEYKRDSRIPCKYGAECYQKNAAHHEKYKHPNKRPTDKIATFSNKRQKLDEANTKLVVPPNDVSDSEDETKEKHVTSEDETKEKHVTSEDERKEKHVTSEDETKEKHVISEDERIEKHVTSEDETNREHVTSEEKETNKKHVENTSESSISISSNTESKTKSEFQIDTSTLTRTPKDFDQKEFIKSKFLVEMPDDFYKFWDFCKSIKSDCPEEALKNVGLLLVGPFDVLADKFSNIIEPPAEQYLLHWRYYYDIPEFQTVIKGDDNLGFHIGYFRDDPSDNPVFMATNCAEKGGEITCLGDNIFAAVFLHLEDIKKKRDPFKKMQITKVQSAVKNKAEELNMSLSALTPCIKNRNSKIVTRTLNKIGLVVPYNRKTQQGYRELSVPGKELNNLFQRYKNASMEKKLGIKAQIEEVFRWASIAIDECDFGTGIELGWDIIYSGTDEFNSVAARFLDGSYRLVQRDAFADISNAHMKNRKRGCEVGIL